MLRVPEKVNSVGVLMITSDKGMAGGYNTFLAKKAIERFKELNDQGIVPKLAIVGSKGKVAASGRIQAGGVKFNMSDIFYNFPNTISAKETTTLAEEMANWFLSGEVDKIEIISSKFINALTYDQTLRTLLPLSPTGIENENDETFKLTSEDGKLKVERTTKKAPDAKEIEPDVIFDQEPDVILNSMLPLYLNSQLLTLYYEAQASELSARSQAMQKASDNAAEVKKSLTRLYNKKRQAAITQELCEINAAGMALEATSATDEMGEPLSRIDNEDTIANDLMRELTGEPLPDEPEAPEWYEAIAELQSKGMPEELKRK